MSKVINEALIALSLKKLKEEVELLKNSPRRGRRGIPGLQGESGHAGPMGRKGDQGIKGDRGPQGLRGLIGEQGPVGLQGEVGPQGLTGDQGLQGIQGEKGDRGEQGLQGQAGPRGLQGPLGEQGERGLAGETGPEGKTGPKGERGLKGEKGDRGSQGEKGETGDRGPQGLEGPKGSRGEKGDTGPRGVQGVEGPQGKDGKDGKDGTNITIEDVKPILDRYNTDYNRFVSNVNKSLASIGGGGLGEKDVIAIAKQYGGTGSGADVDLSAVAQHIIPADTETYDLGTADKKWRDLNLSGSSINLGDAKISVGSSGGIQLRDAQGTTPSLTTSNTTTIPGSTNFDLRNTEGDANNVAREDDGSNALGSKDKDEFGSSLKTIYDCLEPFGQFRVQDLGASESHVGA